MFKVFIDGSYQSTHKTYAEACRHARIESDRYKHSYFTVFQAGDDIEQNFHASSDTLCGVPDFIITPNDSISNGSISISTANALLKVRLPTHSLAMQEHPLI